MSNTASDSRQPGTLRLDGETVLSMLKAHYESSEKVRRGVCLLCAGDYEEASAAFRAAMERGTSNKSLPSYLAACLLAQGDADAAAEHFETAAEQDERETAAQIRHAMSLWAAGRGEEAVASLRKRIEANPESAELHFQLGTLLTSLEEYEEAEVRFAQVLSIDRDHHEALVSLALCCGLRGGTAEAVKHLQRAQSIRPWDARIGLLLAQAATALRQKTPAVRIRASMPSSDFDEDGQGIEELARLLEAEPDFVDAFTSAPGDQIDRQVFIVLARTVDTILLRRPDDAVLHFQRGRILERLGRPDDAIQANERAVQIDPAFTRALIELGRLYARTDRTADAVSRLEDAVAAGADYADVHLLLGNMYRSQGLVGHARTAYRRALVLNESYEAARVALAELPA